MQSWQLDCLSESQFENIPADICEDEKAYMYAVITRLRRILNWDPGNDDDEDYLYDRRRGPEIMREVLSLYNRWKEFINQSQAPDIQGIQHLVIFSLAKLSLYYWITDSTIVADILRELFECGGHFSSMFAHIVDRNDARSLLRQTSEYSHQVNNNISGKRFRILFRLSRIQNSSKKPF